MKDFYSALLSIIQEECIKTNEEMSKHVTFKVGGTADYYVTVDSIEHLSAIIECCRMYKTPFYILGNGSNVLISDKGIRGLVIQFDSRFSDLEIKGTQVHVEAGMLLGTLGARLLEAGLTGLEWGAGIPGSVGGAVYMNAGAYGGQMQDVIKNVTYLGGDMHIHMLPVEQLHLGYRDSIFMHQEAYILSADLIMKNGDKLEIKNRMNELAKKRREKQPLEYASAGSTFKRPKGFFAGKLIQDSGLRGYKVGDAQISEKHCGFVINCGAATAQDIYQLTQNVIKIVHEKTGVVLEREVRLLGDFPC